MEYALEQIGLPYEVERKADARTFPMSKRPDSGKVTLTPIMVAFEK